MDTRNRNAIEQRTSDGRLDLRNVPSAYAGLNIIDSGRIRAVGHFFREIPESVAISLLAFCAAAYLGGQIASAGTISQIVGLATAIATVFAGAVGMIAVVRHGRSK